MGSRRARDLSRQGFCVVATQKEEAGPRGLRCWRPLCPHPPSAPGGPGTAAQMSRCPGQALPLPVDSPGMPAHPGPTSLPFLYSVVLPQGSRGLAQHMAHPEEPPGGHVGDHIPLQEQMVDLALWGPGLPRGVTGRAAGWDQSHPAALGGRVRQERRLLEARKGARREGRAGQLCPILQHQSQKQSVSRCAPLPRMLSSTASAHAVPARQPPKSPSPPPPSTMLHVRASRPLHPASTPCFPLLQPLHPVRTHSAHVSASRSLSGTRDLGDRGGGRLTFPCQRLAQTRCSVSSVS